MGTSAASALARRAFRDARTRTLAFAGIFVAYSYIQPTGYKRAYPTVAERLHFAHSFAENNGLRLFYGEPHDLVSVAGYSAWRAGGTLAIAVAVFGLFASVRALRAEEDSGRGELVLAGVVGRRTAFASALAAIAAGVALLWGAEFAGFVLGGLPAGGSAYLALATASVAPVCAGVGALASQLAPTRRGALALGGLVVGLMLLLRALADTLNGTGWLRWLTPLGWAEQMRPFAGAEPLVLLLPLAATLLLLVCAARFAAGRDLGTGLLPARDSADPRLYLLSSPAAQALRGQLGVLLAWIGGVSIFGFILGTISKSISPADVSQSTQRQIAKLGSGSIATPTGYLAFVFIFVIVAVSLFMCAQISAARQEEADQRLETVLALPVGRCRWLAGRLLLAAGGAAAIVFAAGLFIRLGAASVNAGVGLSKMLEAGLNALPVALLFLGLAALAFAALPRASTGIAYGLVAVAFLWYLVGSLSGTPDWVVGLTPFKHVGLVPAQTFRSGAAAVMVAVGAAAATAAIAVFRQRDLVTA
jgi:polyether ionophore transport system permease protein